MKMASELIYRGHEVHAQSGGPYSPKQMKSWPSLPRPVRYLVREQRLLFLIAGMALATVVLSFVPMYSSSMAEVSVSATGAHLMVGMARRSTAAAETRWPAYRAAMMGSVGGKVPLGLKRKVMRVVVTGGAGFVGSHLVDRLIERGDSVIVVDNFFTGRKENVMHHFGNPNFELIRHDVVEPLLLEVDQIYHLACPASPVHYKFNPVKTIISFALIHSCLLFLDLLIYFLRIVYNFDSRWFFFSSRISSD
ncbi:hypothetical protein HPP92_001160 [Vanilla planifolia]|uniref:UDP-glucuronate decarboxylase n=1 Tax=Vanilla planifolia TaxID=51239 RepID=A0A835S203_VANPL|nr:hypothetical protein HPP92_001160 [Vanilla planifolia]